MGIAASDTELLPAWLCGIARNLTRTARRRRGRKVPSETAEIVSTTTPFDEISERHRLNRRRVSS